MPGWHEATKELRRQGRLEVVGIVQEQHPDRARLFMQWKRMGWPVMVDSLNLLDVSVVPITLAIDEYGVIRDARPSLRRLEESFLDRTYEKPDGPLARPVASPDLRALRAATAEGGPDNWRAYADALVMWAGADRLDEAVAAQERAAGLDSRNGAAHFRLGVAHRKRYDSDHRTANDFQEAVRQWERALAIDPNNYIWRRRIQQYGPRLEKPYPFYDWVPAARAEILARGETPLPLGVEPRGAELAKPSRDFEQRPADAKEPDPKGLVSRDSGKLIEIEQTVVPASISPGGSARVHLVLRPNPRTGAHWNNEAKGLALWIDTPEGWQINATYHTLQNPPRTVSREDRRIEFEVRSPRDARSGMFTIPAYVLYYVCEGPGTQCLYRRQDVRIAVSVE